VSSDEWVKAAACSLKLSDDRSQVNIAIPLSAVLVDLAVRRRDDPPDGFDR
jgi:hypothetical protein